MLALNAMLAKDKEFDASVQQPANTIMAFSFSWRRLVLRVMVVQRARQWTGLLMHFDTQDEEYQARLKTSTSNNKSKTTRVAPMVLATGCGKALPPSKAGTPKLRAEDCVHPVASLAMRGNGTSWMTCIQCNSRWERVPTAGRQQRQADGVMTYSTAPTCGCGLAMLLKMDLSEGQLFFACSKYETNLAESCRQAKLVTNIADGERAQIIREITASGTPVETDFVKVEWMEGRSTYLGAH